MRAIVQGLVAVSILGAIGCGRVVHETYHEPDCHNPDVDGFVYFESSPYLLVHPDGKGGLVWTILNLPDPTKKRIAKPEAFAAKLTSSMSFEKGVLTTSDAMSDSTAVGKAIVAAAKTALGAHLMDRPILGREFRPEIFKIIVSGSRVEFWGVEADEPVVVTLPRSTAS